MGRERSRPSRPEHRSSAQRLQKILAAAGVASRRDAERWIREGRVAVNGRVVSKLGARADPARDTISVDGRRLPKPRIHRTVLLYKPRGVVTTTRDPRARKTVLDLIPGRERLFPVGRLDSPSEGLLLLTNDGALTHQLLHPSFEVPRTYRVRVEGRVSQPTLRALRAGVRVDGKQLARCEVKIVAQSGIGTLLEITLFEGRKRQIRKMMRAVGHPVRRLVRTRFGPLRLGRLRPGEWRELRPAEERALKRLVEEIGSIPPRPRRR
jgi:23S rRNA pseudouridine2605 synthase